MRKVLIVAHEVGVMEKIELRHAAVASTKTNEEVLLVNPLGQIPTLILDTGEALYDSQVICHYLDVILGSGALHPDEPTARLALMRRHVIADGLMGAMLNLLIERSRRQPEQSELRIVAIKRKFPEIFAALEADTRQLASGSPFDVGQAAAVAALSYLDFRLAEEWIWRDRYPALARWFAAMCERPSVIATTYYDELATVVKLTTPRGIQAFFPLMSSAANKCMSGFLRQTTISQ